jgi:hypothetical protein
VMGRASNVVAPLTEGVRPRSPATVAHHLLPFLGRPASISDAQISERPCIEKKAAVADSFDSVSVQG